MFLEPEEFALGALSLNLSLSLFLQATLGCVFRSELGLEVWVKLQTGSEALKTSGWPRRRHVCGAGVSVES